MKVKLADLDQMRRESGIFKYVRLVDDSVRFVAIDFYTPDHCQMVDPGEQPVSGGSISVQPDARVVRTITHGSSTLRLPSLPDDEEIITRVLWPED